MIINEKVYVMGNLHPQLTFLQINNFVTKDAAEIILFNFQTFAETPCETIERIIELKKIIYIDGTYEILESSVLEKINSLSKINSIHYFCNPTINPQELDLLEKLIQRGLVCVPKQYFIHYADFYKPAPNNIPMSNKSYLCLTGKVNPTRTFLIALLSKYKLLQHGHVSYFGENYTDPEFDRQPIDFYKNVSYLSDAAKSIIEEEIKKIKCLYIMLKY